MEEKDEKILKSIEQELQEIDNRPFEGERIILSRQIGNDPKDPWRTLATQQIELDENFPRQPIEGATNPDLIQGASSLFKAKTEECEKLERELRVYRDEVRRLSEKLVDAHERFYELNSKYMALTPTPSAQAELARLTELVRDWQRAARINCEEKEKAEEAYNQAQSRLIEMQEELKIIKELCPRLHKADTECEELKEQVKALERSFDSQKGLANHWKQQAIDSEQRVQGVSRKYDELREQLQKTERESKLYRECLAGAVHRFGYQRRFQVPLGDHISSKLTVLYANNSVALVEIE